MNVEIVRWHWLSPNLEIAADRTLIVIPSVRIPISLKIGAGLMVPLILLLIAGAISYRSVREMASASERVEHTLDVESDISDLHVSLLGAESAVRGFIVTGDERYLSAFSDSPSIVREQVRVLRQKTADDPRQQSRLDALEPVVAAKLRWMATTAATRRRGGLNAAAEAIASGRGREMMSVIRTSLLSMQSEEQTLMTQGMARERATARRTEHSILLTAVLAFAFVAVAALFIRRDLVGRGRAEAALRSLSMVDELTGFYNRRGFFIHAEDRVKLAHRLSKPEVLFFADLDGLKIINDEFGHAAGDEALVIASSLLRASFRESDIIARFGGDEFVVLALLDRVESASIPARGLRERLDAWNAQSGRPYRLSMSIGTTPIAPGSRLEDLVAAADHAMYATKKEARTARQSDPDAVRIEES